MAEALSSILALAADGSPITCTLSPESVQVILFALGYMYTPKKWVTLETGDTVSDDEWHQIVDLLDKVSQEMLP